MSLGARKIAQQLRAHVVLVENLASIPSPHVWFLTTPVLGELTPSSGCCGFLQRVVHINSLGVDTYIYTENCKYIKTNF